MFCLMRFLVAHLCCLVYCAGGGGVGRGAGRGGAAVVFGCVSMNACVCLGGPLPLLMFGSPLWWSQVGTGRSRSQGGGAVGDGFTFPRVDVLPFREVRAALLPASSSSSSSVLVLYTPTAASEEGVVTTPQENYKEFPTVVKSKTSSTKRLFEELFLFMSPNTCQRRGMKGR